MEIIEIVIGIIFVMLLFSLLATTIMETLAGILALRGENLNKALEHILSHDGNPYLLNEFKSNNLYKQLCSKRVLSKSYRPPSYISSESFWSILSNILFKDTDGSTLSLQYKIKSLSEKGEISEYIESILLQFLHEIDQEDSQNKKVEALKSSIEDVEDDQLRLQLLSFAESGERQIVSFKSKVQNWYNTVMDRTSGWYKRTTQSILFLIGLVIAIAFNADVLAIYQQLSADPALAIEIADKAGAYLVANPDPTLQKEVNELIQVDINAIKSPLGIGWDMIAAEEVKDFNYWLLKVLGWLVTALAVTLGAPFWFDLLQKLVNIRNAGKTPSENAK